MAEFNAKTEKEHIINWIREWFDKNGKDCTAVIGISGGADSTILAALLKEALGVGRILGVLLPNGVQGDIADSYEVVNSLGIPHVEINIEDAYKSIYSKVLTSLNPLYMESSVITPQARQNLPPRLRMTVLYAVSQSINGRVINTTNASEAYIGWGTRWGDAGIGDMCPLINYTKTEILAIGDLCDITKELVHKAPSDGLCGQTDEDKLGFTYYTLDNYIRYGILPTTFEAESKIDHMHDSNLFKLKMPESCIPTFL